ncbi:hypothetical protein V1527DRAFT_458543, partial [Lipomyces starkeyi]
HGLPDPPPAAAPPPPRADATHPARPRVDGDAYVARTRFRTGNAFPSPSDAGAYDRRQLLTPWGLKYCGNCNRLWCRDKNATHNFFSRMVFLLAQPKGAVADAVAESRQDGPGYLCRQVRQEQDDALAPKSKRVAKRNRDDRAVDVTTPAGKRQQAMHIQAAIPEATSTSKPKRKPKATSRLHLQHQFDVEGSGEDYDYDAAARAAAIPQQPAAPSAKPKAKAKPKSRPPTPEVGVIRRPKPLLAAQQEPAVARSFVKPKPKRNPRIKRKADAECEDAIAAPDAAAIVAPSKSKRCKLISPYQQLLDNECV